MADDHPRSVTGLPTEPVGWLPCPTALQEAYGEQRCSSFATHPIRCAGERDKDLVHETIGRNPRVEFVHEIADQLVRVANVIDRNELRSTDDRGFPPFSIAEKPDHGSPGYARAVAFQKIRHRVEGSTPAAEKLGP